MATGLRSVLFVTVCLAITYSTVNAIRPWFFIAPIDNVVISLTESSVTVNCPVATMVDNIEWFNAITAAMVSTGNDYVISTTGSYYCQVTEGRGVYRSNTFTVYRTSFADNFSIHPENFTIFGDTTRVAFECRINTFIATQDDANQLNIIWEGSSTNDNFTMLSGDIFNPLPGYSILVMDRDDTLPIMVHCQAVFTPLMGDDMVVATSNIAYIVDITDILGSGSTSGYPDGRTFLIKPSNEIITQMDTAVFVCIPANTSVQASWSDYPTSFIGVNNFYLTVTNVMENTTVMCTIGDITVSASIIVQEIPALMGDTILPSVTVVREGDTVTLQCLPIITYPAPNITWLADGANVQFSSGNFTIATVDESDEMIYQCLVEATFVPSMNSIGLPPSISFITTTAIDCVPDIDVIVTGATNVNGTYDVMSGATFNITCMLTCPTATLIWRRNDDVISTGPSTMVTIDGFSVEYMTNNDGEITRSVLTRNMAQLNDTAMYQCATTVQTIQSNDTAGVIVYANTALFQIRLQPIGNCEEWTEIDREQKQSDIKEEIIQEVVMRCSCEFTSSNIIEETFSCRGSRGQFRNTVVYRAMITLQVPPSITDADDIFTNINQWVQTEPSVRVNGITLYLDSECPAMLDSFDSIDCVAEASSDRTNQSSSSSIGIIIGAAVASVVIILLLIIAVVIIVVYCRHKSHNVATHEQQHTYDFIEAQLTTGDNHPVNSEGNTTIANPTYDEAYEILDQINTDDVEMDRNPAYAETTFT